MENNNNVSFDIEDVEVYFMEHVASGEMSIGEAKAAIKGIERASKRGYTNREGYVPKERADYSFGRTAYQFILDSGGTAEEALEYSRQYYEKDRDWVEAVKNVEGYSKNSKLIVDNCEDHPVQREMVRNQVLDKSNVRTSDRVNTLLRKLATARSANDRIKTLEQIAKLQNEEINKLKAKDVHNENRFKELTEKGYLVDNPKQLAKAMWKEGCKQEDVVEATGKSLRTVQNWWKEFKE